MTPIRRVEASIEMRQEECREEYETWLAACHTPKTAQVTAKLKALLAEAERHARDEVVKSAMRERKLCSNHCRSVGRTRGRLRPLWETLGTTLARDSRSTNAGTTGMNGSQVVRLEFVSRSKPPKETLNRSSPYCLAVPDGESSTQWHIGCRQHTLNLEEKMSMSERSIKGRRLALTLGLAMLITATGYTDQEALVKSVGDALTEVNATKSQLAATMSSLNALLATKPGDDLRPAYSAYVDNVDKTKLAAATTQQRVDQMNNDSANYFSSWKSDNDNISSPQLHKVANHRLEQVQKNYANAIASLQAASDKFTPFLSDLSDIQTALSNDLTAKGLKAAKGVFEKANHDHGEVQKEIGTAIRHLTATQLALSPVAGAK